MMWDSYYMSVEGLLLHRVDSAGTLFERCGCFRTLNNFARIELEHVLVVFGLRKIEGDSAEFVDQDVLQVITLI
jgi:hypothetical protein